MADRITPQVAGPKGVGIGAPFAPEPHEPIAGDWTDDDGRTLDDYFEPNPQGPNLVSVESPLTVPATYDDTAPKVTRLITRTLPIGNLLGTDGFVTTDNPPIMLVTADAKRCGLRLRANISDASFAITTPAAGAQMVWTNPFPGSVEIIAFKFTSVTDATVITRTTSVNFYDERGNILAVMSAGSFAPTASSSSTHSMAQGYPYANPIGGNETGPIPNGFRLPKGGRIQTAFQNLQAGDQIANGVLMVRYPYFRIAGALSDCYGAAEIPANIEYDLDKHTGPVWVYAPNVPSTSLLHMTTVSE